MVDDTIAVPLAVRLHLGRAAVQTIADASGVDLLHIKGDAVDATLRPGRQAGSDVDAMVRPGQIGVMDRALRRHSWTVYSTFRTGSPFGHAQTYRHEIWGYLDLHRSFPGIELDGERAFDRLWKGRGTIAFAGVDCAVPAMPAQATILLLNAARAGATRRNDLTAAWHDRAPAERAAIEREVRALDARLAFDAAFGRLDLHRGERGYPLWKAVTTGGGRVEEWWGRIRAARSLRDRAALVALAAQVNIDALAHRLGREPTRREVAAEFFKRPMRGVGELWRRGVRR